jgi:hypothetical protein
LTAGLIYSQSYEQIFHGLGALDHPLYSYSGPSTGFIVRSPNVSHPMGNEVDDENVLEGSDRRKRRPSRDKESLSQIHSVRTEDSIRHLHAEQLLQRRRAQNRASQRAFRDRNEKHVKELERRFEELEGKHKTLQQSYSELSGLQDGLRREMEALEAENELLRRTSGSSGSFRGMLEGQDFEKVSLDGSLLYSGPAFYFDNDLLDTHKEISPGQVDDAV